MQFGSILTVLTSALVALPATMASRIAQNTYSNINADYCYDDVVIEHGVFWCCFDTVLRFGGAFINHGSFYLFHDRRTGTLLNLGVVGCDYIENYGLMYFNSIHAGIQIDLMTSHVKNSGDFFFMGEDAYNSKIKMPGTWEITKTGSFNMYFDSRPQRGAMLGTVGTVFTNDGQICLRNAYIDSLVVKGKGCINIGEDSVFRYQSSTDIFPASQTIFLSSKTSMLFVGADRQYYAYTIAGWGNGNYIVHSYPIINYSYDTEIGVLTVDASQYNIKYTMKYNIGLGYDPELFELASMVPLGSDLGFYSKTNAGITYLGDVPASSTSSSGCKPCKDAPMFPPEPIE
ncbi:hypothetical protein CAAN3_10S05424 [[Candida] anglica]